jgi:hypothetical protein
VTIFADLYTERGIWRADSAYVFAENDPLAVCFGEAHAGDTLSVRGASCVRSFRLGAKGDADIPAELIASGALLMHVERYDNGKLVRDWKVDPLSIVVTDGNVSATPWTVSVEERVADLENALFGQSSPLFE